jgi:hypothetical protein
MIVIPYFYETARAVYGLERPVKIGANMYGTAKKLILVYLLLTLVGFLSFMATGLTTFDAIREPRNVLWSVTDMTFNPLLFECLIMASGAASPSLTNE